MNVSPEALVAGVAAAGSLLWWTYKLGDAHGARSQGGHTDHSALIVVTQRLDRMEAAVLEIRTALVGALGGTGIVGRLAQMESRLEEIESRLAEMEKR